MSSRTATLLALLVLGIIVVGACDGPEDEVSSIDGLTAEVLQAVAATATESPTATPEPTATPVPPTATMEYTAEISRVKIPNRGYNSLGNPDAPITMFDFSDFL